MTGASRSEPRVAMPAMTCVACQSFSTKDGPTANSASTASRSCRQGRSLIGEVRAVATDLSGDAAPDGDHASGGGLSADACIVGSGNRGRHGLCVKALESFERGKGLGDDSPARYGRSRGAGIWATTDLDELAFGGKAFQGTADLVVTAEILEVTAFGEKKSVTVGRLMQEGLCSVSFECLACATSRSTQFNQTHPTLSNSGCVPPRCVAVLAPLAAVGKWPAAATPRSQAAVGHNQPHHRSRGTPCGALPGDQI